MTPARSAAQNGWRKTFALTRATARRKIAPAPALTNISTVGRKCSTPKITDSATAPAAAASANSPVAAGRMGGNLQAYSSVLVFGLKFKLPPARIYPGAQPEPTAETLSRGD